MNCKDCKKWKKIPIKGWYSNECFEGVQMGTCKSHTVKVNPNYYTDYEGEATDEDILTTYDLRTGANFGCIHYDPISLENN